MEKRIYTHGRSQRTSLSFSPTSFLCTLSQPSLTDSLEELSSLIEDLSGSQIISFFKPMPLGPKSKHSH